MLLALRLARLLIGTDLVAYDWRSDIQSSRPETLQECDITSVHLALHSESKTKMPILLGQGLPLATSTSRRGNAGVAAKEVGI